jgi:hypothetical protein
MVKITLPGNDLIIAAICLRYLSAQAELPRERELAERQVRLAASPTPGERGEAMIAGLCR